MSRQIAIAAIILSAVCHVEAYDMIPRWGAASLFTPSPPTLYISGGKTSTPDGTYSSSPNSGDLIRLSLSSNFSTSSPPYELLNTSSSPAYAWHTLSLTSTDPLGALSFGGDGGSTTPLPAGTDSSWLLSIPSSDTPSFNQQTSDWAAQPQRRILHSATTGNGLVYLTGGQRNDGSGIILSDSYAYNPNTTTFTPLPSLPKGIAHHISTCLSNGTIVVLGGISTSSNTGNPTLNDLGTVYTLDTKSSSPAWWQASVGGSAPPPRRGASGVLMADEKLFMVGGTGMSSAEAMGDVWVLDMRSGVWNQVNTTGQSPSARFDHTAVDVGGGQMLIVGGYGAGSPVSPETFILDTNTNTWTTSFVSASTPSSIIASTPSASASDASQSTINANSASSGTQSSSSSDLSSSSPSSSSSSPSPSSTESPSAQPSTAQLSKSAQIGLAVGVTMGLGVLAALIVLLIRRRKAGYGPPGEGEEGFPKSPSGWLSPRPPPLEKDGQALLGDPRSGARPGEWSEKGGIIGLGLGAMGVGISAFRSGNAEGKYQQLGDEAPSRQPTRRAGAGIKLIGPRSNPSSSAKSPPRVDILHDEDSRTFLGVPKGTDWKVDREKKDEWRSANTVLGHKDDEEDGPRDPFEDVPLIRGGPVPTPTTRSLGPFDDGEEVDITTAVSRGPGLYQLPPLASSDPLDIAGLLAPPAGYNDTSLPHSSHSRSSTFFTTSASDAEEGIVHHAQFASQSSALYSPQETEYVPIKRNESFFRRMAAGGISTLIGGRKEGVKRSISGHIRDPAPGPGPSLWPVESRDDLEEGGSLPHPPSTWNRIGHNKIPSLGSLASARSMRDMVVVQREGTDSSEASLVILEQDLEESSEMGTPILDGLSPLITSGSRIDRSIFASPTEEDLRSERYIPPIITSTPAPTSPSQAQPPSGSPLPKHLVEHRRPVKDMVFSINKRATLGPGGLDPISPTSQYSVTPGQTPLVGGMEDGRRGSWQVRRRESLVVANPDKRGLRGGYNER